MPAVAGVVYRLWARGIAGARPGRTMASVGWGRCEGRHKAGTCGDLMGLGGTWSGWTPWNRHLSPISTPGSMRRVVGEGALRGRSPRTREGRIGPTAQMRGESSEKHHFICTQLVWELTMAWVPPEVYESSPQYWDASARIPGVDTGSSPCIITIQRVFFCSASAPWQQWSILLAWEETGRFSPLLCDCDRRNQVPL